MTIVCNIWMICLELNWLFYDPTWMLQISEFVWALRSSVWVVFINFLLIDATDRNKISNQQIRLFFAVSLYPHSFFANTPFNTVDVQTKTKQVHLWIKYVQTKTKQVNICESNMPLGIIMKEDTFFFFNFLPCWSRHLLFTAF